MKRKSHLPWVCLSLGLLLGGAALAVRSGAAELPTSKGSYVVAATLASPSATQAAAADRQFAYAIANSQVVKYDRASGKELAKSTGPAAHLNSGFLWQGRLYCAHSNYPLRPQQSDIRVLDPQTMKLTIWHTFAEPPGSLTWAVRKGKHWWCHFAHYGQDKHKSVLVQYDEKWQELDRWTYPAELVKDWGAFSLSGGLWQGEHILATGHDKKVIYRLRLPREGKVIEVVDVVPSPFPGQGIATDPKTGGLVGIDRARRQILFAERPGSPPEDSTERGRHDQTHTPQGSLEQLRSQ